MLMRKETILLRMKFARRYIVRAMIYLATGNPRKVSDRCTDDALLLPKIQNDARYDTKTLRLKGSFRVVVYIIFFVMLCVGCNNYASYS